MFSLKNKSTEILSKFRSKKPESESKAKSPSTPSGNEKDKLYWASITEAEREEILHTLRKIVLTDEGLLQLSEDASIDSFLIKHCQVDGEIDSINTRTFMLQKLLHGFNFAFEGDL